MKLSFKLIALCLVAGFFLGPIIPTASAKTLREKNQQARKEYREARAQYLREVEFYKTSRRQFLEAKTKLKKFRNAENKAAYEEEAKDFLEKSVEVMIEKLETIKNWVSNRGSLSQSEKDDIIAEINEDIKWLEDKKSEIADASGSQIKDKAKEVREYWKDHRVKVKKIIGKILTARLDWSIGKAENVAEKTESKIEDLKAAGKDTTDLEAWLNDFREKIELAKAERDKAEEKFKAISNRSDADKLFRQGHQFIKKANVYLREAYKQLVKIVKEIRQLNGN